MKKMGCLLSGVIGGILTTCWNLIVLFVGAMLGYKLGESSDMRPTYRYGAPYNVRPYGDRKS